MTTLRRHVSALVSVSLLALSLTACGDAPEPVAEVSALKGQATRITLDQGFVKALGQLGLTPGTTGDGRLAKGALRFPITGGNVTVFEPGEVSPYVIGQIQHEGSGLTLSAGATTVRLSGFNIDPGSSRVYGDVAVNGETAATSAYLFRLDGRSLKPLETEGRTAVLEGTKVFISPVAAPLLNQTFKTKAVKPSLLVGVAKITVDTRSAD